MKEGAIALSRLSNNRIVSAATVLVWIDRFRKNWLHQAAFHLGAGKSMRGVTRAIQNAFEKHVTY